MVDQLIRSRNLSHTTPSPSATTTSHVAGRPWLSPARLPAIRSVILGTTLFVGLLIWVCFTVGLIPQGMHLIDKLRVLGVTTWLYALVQILDMKIWHSRFAQRRRAASRIPEVLEGWLLAQMLEWQPHWVLFGEVLGMTIIACAWQPLLSGQSRQLGLLRVQSVAPRSIIAWV